MRPTEQTLPLPAVAFEARSKLLLLLYWGKREATDSDSQSIGAAAAISGSLVNAVVQCRN